MKKISDMIKEWKDGEIEFGVYSTTNEEGENLIVEVTGEYVKLTTMQSNNWARVNYYYKDGTIEELYEN